MKQHEFMAKVRERGQYGGSRDAEQATMTVLAVLGDRLAAGEHAHLASQLPGELQDVLLRSGDEGESLGVEEFVSRLAKQLGTSQDAARSDAVAVLSTVAEAVTGGRLSQVLSQLQAGYAELFGLAGLSR